MDTRRRLALVIVLAYTVVACVQSNAGYVDRDEFQRGYLGESYRAWTEGSTIKVEVKQYLGLNVANIDHRLEGDTLYLTPRQVSGGGPNLRVFSVDLSSEELSEGWENRVYWDLGTHDHPIFSPGFWNETKRTPAERVKLRLEP